MNGGCGMRKGGYVYLTDNWCEVEVGIVRVRVG